MTPEAVQIRSRALRVSPDGAVSQPVPQDSIRDGSEELRPLLEAIDTDDTVFARQIFDMCLVDATAGLDVILCRVPVRRVRNDFARHAGIDLRLWNNLLRVHEVC
jgi:hypothetical protein